MFLELFRAAGKINHLVNHLRGRDYYCDTGRVIFETIGEKVINSGWLMIGLAMVQSAVAI